MSYPVLTFSDSYFLQKEILGNPHGIEITKKFVPQFEKYFRKHEKIIMKSIEKYSGFKWNPQTGKIIPIWIFRGSFPPISFPLLLNYHFGDKKFVLLTLIHELTHNILFSRVFIKKENSNKYDPLELEAVTYLITKSVANKVFDKETVKRLWKKSEFDGYKYVMKREKELEERWDLEKKPFKEWIKSNKRYGLVI